MSQPDERVMQHINSAVEKSPLLQAEHSEHVAEMYHLFRSNIVELIESNGSDAINMIWWSGLIADMMRALRKIKELAGFEKKEVLLSVIAVVIATEAPPSAQQNLQQLMDCALPVAIDVAANYSQSSGRGCFAYCK